MAHYALVSTPRELYFDGPSLDDLAAADDESYDIGGTTSPAWRAVLDEASDAKAGIHDYFCQFCVFVIIIKFDLDIPADNGLTPDGRGGRIMARYGLSVSLSEQCSGRAGRTCTEFISARVRAARGHRYGARHYHYFLLRISESPNGWRPD